MNRPCTDTVAGSRGTAIALALAAVAAFAQTPSLAADTCTARSAATVAAGGRALHLRRLRLLPAGRPLAVEAQGRSGRGRPRLPRRLLGPARLEGPLRQRRLHRPPGGAAGEQRRALQLHAAGRGRRPGPQGLAGHRHAARPAARPRRSTCCWRAKATGSPRPWRRRRRSPKRLAAYWAVTEQGHVTAVKAGENRGVTLQHDYVVRDYQTVPAWSARSRRAAGPRLPAAGAGRCGGASARGQPGRGRRRQRPAGAGAEAAARPRSVAARAA